MASFSPSASSTLSVVRRTLVVGAVVGVVGLVLSSSLLPHASQASQQAPVAPQPLLAAAGSSVAGTIATNPATSTAPVLVQGLPDFTQLVDTVGPAVVSIRTTQRINTGARVDMDGDAEAQMREFFRRFFGAPLPEPEERTPRGRAPSDDGGSDEDEERGEERTRGLGSGFIVSADGYVLTNAHVIDGADIVYVTLTDKREFKAKVVGSDKRTDVALVKIDAEKLPATRLGEANRLKVGEWVMAIGSPFGLENTVTAGIVSAKARDTGEEIRFIQTDVAVNPGNSGGPLINMRGEVVGINSQILSRSGGFMGISLSIPIDDAIRVANQLRESGKVIRGRIGVQIEAVSKELAESLGLGKPQGAMVRMVEPAGPADKAGVEAGDIITRFNGAVIDSVGELPRLVAATKPGSKATIQVLRRGAYKDLNVTIEESGAEGPGSDEADKAPKAAPGVAGSLGLSLAELTPAQKSQLKLKGGVLVKAVGGPAARAGVRPGDVILALGNVQVANVQQIEAALAKVNRKRPVTLLVRRGEWAMYAIIPPAGK